MSRTDILLILILVISIITLLILSQNNIHSRKPRIEGYGCDADLQKICGPGCNLAPNYATPDGLKCCYTASGYGPSCVSMK